MTDHSRPPRVVSIPPGVPFLPTLVDTLLDGRLVPTFRYDGDPLALADVSIFVPTRRAARELRAAFVSRMGGRSAILPMIRPLGEFDEDAVLLGPAERVVDLAPPMTPVDRLLLLAPLVRSWRSRLPRHVESLFGEPLILPASVADSLWLARDLGQLMDEIETGGRDWTGLSELVDGELAGWWQVTLEFLRILTEHWPAILAERGRSDPAAHRNALIDAETTRLAEHPPRGPVIAAGSTGSIPATARLLAAVSRLEQGAVVLPGLDITLEAETWEAIGQSIDRPAICGHPQFGLRRLVSTIGIERSEVTELVQPPQALRARNRLLSEALRPADTTDRWADLRSEIAGQVAAGAVDGMSLIEAATPREEALAIAIALREALVEPGKSVALVTVDRELARRVSSELLRFGIQADDSAGSALASSVPYGLLRLLVETVFRPGDPLAIVALLKHPLLRAGLSEDGARLAAETIELVALRGGVGRPDIAELSTAFDRRLVDHDEEGIRKPFWLPRLTVRRLDAARRLLAGIDSGLADLLTLRGQEVELATILRATVAAAERLAFDPESGVEGLYGGDAGEALAAFLSSILASVEPLHFASSEWPDVLVPLVSGTATKPPAGADPRVAILGTLEARLQSFDLLVLGGLNEGSWPARAEADRFMSRIMKSGVGLDPPERRIGQAAHDFMMACGTERLVLTRSERSGDAPAVASRWLQRLLACAGVEGTKAMRLRGGRFVQWARSIDNLPRVALAERPAPTPPVEARPRTFSVTEVETLRRDPYAVYARRVLRLRALEPLLRDPAAAERGTLFHDILDRFTRDAVDPFSPDAEAELTRIGRLLFDKAALPPDVDAVWRPRFKDMVPAVIDWERGRGSDLDRKPEIKARSTEVADTGVWLSGRADRIDLRPGGMADIIDYKTGSSPSVRQAHTLLSPQLALEAALLLRGAFGEVGSPEPADLLYVRLRPDGSVVEDSILDIRGSLRTAADLAEDAWARLAALARHYDIPANGYLSRALPFREGDTDGEYDHLARVQEWATGEEAEGEA